MSALKVKQTKAKLLKLFEEHLDLHDIGEKDPEREVKILSRCLAAFAVYQQAGCTPEEAAAAVWDGADDNGIDAAFVDTSDQQVIFVQAKWIQAGAGEPEAKDLRTFADGVKDAVEQENDGFHTRLSTRLSIVQEALLEVGTSTKLVIATTGKTELAPHGTGVMDKLVSHLNGDDSDEMATYEIMGLTEVFEALATNAASSGITVEATLYEWSFFSSPHAAYFGVIDGLQLKNLWTTYGNRLVARNIRHALGSTDINEAISKTAQNEPEKFWYFNNGITLVADEARRAPSVVGARSAGNFSFAAASIVNGAQTVSTLGRMDKDEELGRVRVPIRVILLNDTPEGFGGEVTRTNNLQNRVEARDFVAQDPEQHRLQREMEIEDVDYQYLRGERSSASDRSTDLMEVTTALACASGDATLATLAKTAIGRFFADLKRAPYKTIYNPSVRGARAFNAVLVQRQVEKWIETKKKSLDQKKGLAWGLLVHGNRVLESGIFSLLNVADLEQPISDFTHKLDGVNIESKAELMFEAMLRVLEREHEGRFMAVLFKSPNKSRDVLQKANAEIEIMADTSLG